jgi:hypothetical protein
MGIGLVIALHIGLVVAAYTTLYTFGAIPQAPNSLNTMRWDAGLFYRLAQTGYDDAASGINAFFPFLPLVWKLTGLSALKISLLNALCGYVGTGLLAYTFGLSARQLLVVLSGPMLFFTMVPYAEAFFFLWGAFLLTGLHRRKHWIVLIGLLGACLTRSAATLFIPAYLFAELLWWNAQPWYQSLLRVMSGVATILSAVGVVMFMQYKSHGDAWAFYKVHELWQHTLKLPDYPLHSSAGINVLWLDAFALIVALCSLVVCMLLGIKWLQWIFGSPDKAFMFPPRAVLFSLGYSVGAGFFIVFYQASDLVGLARYILASPFFVVLLWYIWNLTGRQQSQMVKLVLGVAFGVIGWLGGVWQFNSFYAGQAAAYFALFLVYIGAYLIISTSMVPRFREVMAGLYIINLLMLIYLHQLFIQGVWIN